MNSPIPNLTGQLVGNWSLLRQLGAGAFGAVYEAQHLAIAQRRAAVKVLHPHLSADESVQRRFLNEANAASQIEHQNIIQIYDGGVTDNGVCYVVMELVAGQSLETLLASGRPTPLRVVQIAVQIASALAAAHAVGIVHREQFAQSKKSVLRFPGTAFAVELTLEAKPHAVLILRHLKSLILAVLSSGEVA